MTTMRCYITSSFGDSKEEIEKLCTIVKSAGFEDFNFIRDIERYQKVFDDPKELMQGCRDEIKKSDALLIDITDKPTGRAVAAGMAYVLRKKVIVVMKRGTNVKDSVKGIADLIVEYDVIEDVINPLKRVLRKWQ